MLIINLIIKGGKSMVGDKNKGKSKGSDEVSLLLS